LYLKKNPKRGSLRVFFDLRFLRFNYFWKGVLEKDLKSHAVSTFAMSCEKIAIALEDSAIECYMVIVIITVENNIKFIEAEALPFLRIAFGFVDLADHSRVHYQSPWCRR
jgi:hypothetical protein